MALVKAIHDYESFETIKDMIDSGECDVNNPSALWALIEADRYYEFDMFKCIVDAGALLDTQDVNGNTVLMKMIGNSNCEPMIKYIVNRGARINVRNNLGKSALTFAIDFCEYRTVDILLQKGAVIGSELNLAYGSKDFIAMQQLIPYGARFDSTWQYAFKASYNMDCEYYMTRLYPIDHLRSVANILRQELVQLMNETESDLIRAKTDLENDSPVGENILELPYHRVLDGVTRFIDSVMVDSFYRVDREDLQHEYDEIALVIKALAQVIHTRPRGRMEAVEMAERESKRFKR